MQDLTHPLWMLGKSPGRRRVNALLLRPLPAQGTLRRLVSTTNSRSPGNLPLPHLTFTDLGTGNAVFAGLASVAVNDSRGVAPPASSISARRAARVDPFIALRTD